MIESVAELDAIVQSGLSKYSDQEVEVITRFFNSLREISEAVEKHSAEH